MSAERSFWHGGLRVDVYAKSFKWTGMPFTVLLGSPPDDDKIRKMIDAAQRRSGEPAMARTCTCPPPFIPQHNGTCGVCALHQGPPLHMVGEHPGDGDDITARNSLPVFPASTPLWHRICCVLGYHKPEIRFSTRRRHPQQGYEMAPSRLRDQCGRCDTLLDTDIKDPRRIAVAKARAESRPLQDR